ncbi:MAG: hypothetical protein OXL41_10920 [Nitrospinae bacterium]|nr:hypothetical protein [Nitrospinota bacterium]
MLRTQAECAAASLAMMMDFPLPCVPAGDRLDQNESGVVFTRSFSRHGRAGGIE